MINTRLLFIVVLSFILTALLVPLAFAQEEGHVEAEEYNTSPLVLPASEDFAPSEKSDEGSSPIGVSSYFETSETLKVISLTPKYSFSKKFKVKARLPLILQSKRTGFFGEETASGIGDIGLEGEYTYKFTGTQKLLRLQGTIKLPTGDNENMEGDNVKMPLGTGSVDLMLRGQYTQATQKSGFLASALFRINDKGESIYENVDANGNSISTESISQTNGNQFVVSAFGRHIVGTGIWLNLGVSVMMTGKGEKDSGNAFIDDQFNQKSTLMDLYPGVSYKFGPITPYLGARIPLKTKYDDVNRLDERDPVFIVQFTYRPESMLN